MSEDMKRFKEVVDEIVELNLTHVPDVADIIVDVLASTRHSESTEEEGFQTRFTLRNIRARFCDLWCNGCQKVLDCGDSGIDERLETLKRTFRWASSGLLHDLDLELIRNVGNPINSAFKGFMDFLDELFSLDERAINARLSAISSSPDKPQACILIETIEREIASLVFGPKSIVEQTFSEHKNSIERITGLINNLCDTKPSLFKNQDKLSKGLTKVRDVIKDNISKLACLRICNMGNNLREKQALFVLSSLSNFMKDMKDYVTEYVEKDYATKLNLLIDAMLECSQLKLERAILNCVSRTMVGIEDVQEWTPLVR